SRRSDKLGVILDVEVTTGQTNEGEMIEPQVDEVEATTTEKHRPWWLVSLYLTATSFGQSSICTRATIRYLPSSGLKIDASPSFPSNQSLPRASMMLGLCVMRKVFLPFSGICASILRSAAARRLFSSGDTTRPPSVRSVVFSMSLNPASTAVSNARLKLLV